MTEKPISRGKNYTEREKLTLTALVDKYKSIIENKCTNAVYTLEKNKTWEKITLEYNSGAQEERSTKQLQAAYNNSKRLTRQNIANENKGIKAEGGGTYTPMLSDAGAQMLAIMGNQVKPLCNQYDSATEFYFDENSISIKVEPDHVPLQPKKRAIEPKRTKTFNIPKKTTRKENIKMQYYRKKLQCAIIEKKTRFVEYKSAFKKQKLLDLEIKIKTIELENQQKPS